MRTVLEMRMADPRIRRINKIACWKVFRVDKSTYGRRLVSFPIGRKMTKRPLKDEEIIPYSNPLQSSH
jgi:hypothetical protein